MSQANWEADKMLDVYIYDYLVKRNLQASAQAFQVEGKVSAVPVAIDAPGGFLFEWWSVFWDIFIARTKDKHSEVAASYIETQQLKTREQQQLQQQQQLQLQLLRHQQLQQPRRDVNPTTINNGVNNMGSDATMRQSTANAMATKIYEECLKHPQKRDALEEASMKRYAENPNQLLDTNQTSLLKVSATPGQSAGQILQSGTGNINGNMQQAQIRSQTISAINQDGKADITGVLSQRTSAQDSAIFGAPSAVKPSLLSPGINQGANTLPLKGWPLTGLDQLRPNMMPTKSFVQSPQQYHQIQMLNPQQQQQLLLQAQAQGNLGSSNILTELDSRRIRMMLSRNAVLNKEGQPSGIGDMMQSLGSPMQMNQNNSEMIMKIPQQQQAQAQQQIQQLSAQQAQATQQQIPALALQQERILAGVADGNISNNYRHNELTVSKGQSGRKRKQPPSSSGPTNSTGTGNTVGPNSAPSTPSIHTPGDVISIASALQRSGSTSKSSLNIYGSDGTGPLPTSSNQLAEIDRFPEDASLDDNVESFLSYDEADQRENLFNCGKRSPSGHSIDVSKGFSLTEVRCIKASNSKVVACHFSPDGKLLASAGHDKKAVLWSMENFKPKGTLEEHNIFITDVRFSGISTRLATSSFDRTVKVWDVDSPSYSLRSFTGHRGPVMSLDFSPVNEDILCSCDGDNEIRYWSVNQGSCTKTFPGGISRVRFQPRVGRFLAAAADNTVSIFDVETTSQLHCLQSHTKTVHSISWDASGDYVASVSEDSVRVWSLRSGSEGQCVYELSCNGNKFHSCVFHPVHSRILVIGCYQSIELWQIQEKKSVTMPAHEGIIESLAQSSITGMVASASHDKCVKLWK